MDTAPHFLHGISEEDAAELFTDVSAASALFRMLSPLAQQVAIRLYYGGSVTKAQLGSIAGTNETVRAAVEELTDIHIVFKERDKYCVHGAFANAFAELLAAPVTNDAQSSDHKAKNALSNDEELLKYARMQWDTVRFHALRNSDAVDRRFVQSDSVEMSGKLLDAFESANLVVKKGTNNQSTYSTTDAGHRFLLKETRAQLWILLDALCNDTDLRKSILRILLQLSDASSRATTLSKGQITSISEDALEILAALGLVLVKKKVLPTPLVDVLLTPRSPRALLLQRSHLLVESNYRIYASTASLADYATISLFAAPLVLLPNVLISRLDRRALQRVLRSGCDVADVDAYIRAHLRPAMQALPVSLLSTILDQLRLWAAERNRVACTAGVMYDDFGPGEYAVVAREIAKDGGLLWQNDTAGVLLVRANAHEKVRAILKAHRNKSSA